MACWQTGYATDCKSGESGSIPLHASNFVFFDRITLKCMMTVNDRWNFM